MGMYTEFNIGVALKTDTPNNVIDILKYMSGSEEDEKCPVLPDHPFFKADRWRMLFVCDSYYFDGETNTTFNYDCIDKKWHLTVRSNLKNYDSEIEKFLDWIRPYLDTIGFLGYYWYEEFDEPTLIYNNPYEDAIELGRVIEPSKIKLDITRY